MWGELAGHVLREAENGGLRRGGNESFRKWGNAGSASNVKYCARAGIDHVFAEDLAGEMSRQQVGADDSIEFLVGDIEIRCGRVHPRRVYDCIDATMLLDDPVKQGLH